MIRGQALGRSGVVMLLSLGLAACGIMAPIANRQPPADEGKERVGELVGRFEQTCLGRDLMSNPYPDAGKRIPDETGFYEVEPGSCNFWSIVGPNWGQYDKTFVTYNRGRVVREFKRRFGVIYHHSAPISQYCAKGDRHLMLLRDSTTWVTIQFMARDNRTRLCDDNLWLAYGFKLSAGEPLFLDSRDPDESYVVDRLNAVNLNRLSDEERQTVAGRWGRMSATAKDEHKERIADAIRRIRSSQEFVAEQFREDQALQREYNQRRKREEERSAAALNEMLMGAMGELYKESATMNARNAEQIQQRAAISRANAAFSGIKGFNASQLPASLHLRGTWSDYDYSDGDSGDDRNCSDGWVFNGHNCVRPYNCNNPKFCDGKGGDGSVVDESVVDERDKCRASSAKGNVCPR